MRGRGAQVALCCCFARFAGVPPRAHTHMKNIRRICDPALKIPPPRTAGKPFLLLFSPHDDGTRLKAYVESVALTQPGVRRVCLIAKAGLLGMYASCGFSLKGLSPVVHGKDPWFEMRIDLDSSEPRLLRFVQVTTGGGGAQYVNVLRVYFPFIRGASCGLDGSLSLPLGQALLRPERLRGCGRLSPCGAPR